ncbi:hypothetical protein Tco_0007069 [Tanacetum coccineum]
MASVFSTSFIMNVMVNYMGISKERVGIAKEIPCPGSFYFGYGDFIRVVIIEALDEFKGASSLVPKIPKSTIFFWRLQLLLYVLSSMHNYWASVFILRVDIIHDIKQLMCAFLWCQEDMKHRKAKVSWDDIYLPIFIGGLDVPVGI